MPRKARWPYVERTAGGFRASVRAAGARFKGPVRDTAEVARQDVARLLEQRKAGTIELGASATLGSALADIVRDMERRDCRPGAIEAFRSHLAAAVEHFGEAQKLQTLTVEQVQAFVDARKKQVSGLTIKHNVDALARALRRAGVEPNPAKSPMLLRPRVQKRDARKRMSWPEVVEALRRLQGDQQEIEREVVRFIACTGLRRAEVARLRRSDVDLVAHRLLVEGKTGPREYPFPNTEPAWRCVEVLLGLTDEGAEFLLPGDTERQRATWVWQAATRAAIVAKEPRLQLHELRRCFGSRVAASYPLPVVSALLGHAVPGVTGLYVLADLETLRKATTEVWGDFA